MKVLISVKSLRPEYGGPAYSVSRLAAALVEAGIDVGLWAPDSSAPTTPYLAGGDQVQRLAGTMAQAVTRFGVPDLVHDNGIWAPHNHQLARFSSVQGIPRIVSARGMLEPWAVNHKRWKKRLAWMAYQRRDLQSAVGLHATADAEVANLARLHLRVPVHVIPNGVDLPEISSKGAQSGATRTALFLGRLYPVKGLPMLIDAWAATRPAGWTLRIAGPDEASHRSSIERAVAVAGLGSVVSFSGPVTGDEKRDAFRQASFLVLPSHSESFGMVVAEALAHSLPVLTTTAVPWPALGDRQCGLRVVPTVEGLSRGLVHMTSLGPAALEAMGDRGRAFVAEELSWPTLALRVQAMYEEAVA